jgi:hypothetical protein
MGTVRKQLRPRNRQTLDGRMKVHLRLFGAGPRVYRLVTLRAGTEAAFSTNYFHNTWHILSDLSGARLLARLLWGLAYQTQRGTMVLIHGEHLRPTPFEGDRSDPFLLVPAHFTRLDRDALRTLKKNLNRLGPGAKTIRWHTFGLDTALESGRREWASLAGTEQLWRLGQRGPWRQERMVRCGGFICYLAPPAILRWQALQIHNMWVKDGNYATEMDCHFLAEASSKESYYGDGEVQIFADYRQRVAAAAQARREILPGANVAGVSETLQETISWRRDETRRLRRG